MEEKKIIIDRAILVGLNADCFTPEETSDEKTLDELEALLETAGGTLELDRHFSLFSRSYSIDSLGWEVEGDFFGVDYAITKGSQTVARMEKAWPAFHDRYRLEIADPADAMAALCTVLAIDCCDEHHQN